MDREQTRLAVEKSLLAAVVESSDDAIITKDLDGVITSWNRGAEVVFGYESSEAIGRNVSMLIPESLKDEEPEILRRIRKGEKVDHYETVRRRKDGSVIDVSLTVSPIRDPDGVIIGASKIGRDITFRKRSDAVERSAGNLSRVLAAQEEERKRIARDLHDHLGQKMTGLRLQIESLLSEFGEKVEIRKRIETIRAIAEDIDSDIGFFSWEFRATELEGVGLISALRTYLKEWSRQFQIPADFRSNKKSDSSVRRFAPAIETNVYRVVQEALNNIVKHANPTRVGLIVQESEGYLNVVIEDDGAGFDATGHTTDSGPGGWGLVTMHERMEMIGGTLEIESKPDAGTSVIARVPLGGSPTFNHAKGRSRNSLSE